MNDYTYNEYQLFGFIFYNKSLTKSLTDLFSTFSSPKLYLKVKSPLSRSGNNSST